MRQAEMTVLLPPATADTLGNITARTYPVTIGPTGGTDLIRLDGVSIAPSAGIAEVWVRGAGSDRRQVVERSTAIPQAVGGPFRPMELTLVNLNTEAPAQLVIELSVIGTVPGLGGAARFGGLYPEGTDGQRETYDDTAGDRYVTCQGPGFNAWMTTNGPTVTRSIRDIIGRTRILAPTGTGNIPVGGTPNVTLIIKKDGLVLEASADTLDLLSTVFNIGVPTPGTVRILGMADGAVPPAALAYPGPTPFTAQVTPNEAAPSGVLASSTVTLDAGTWRQFVVFSLQADGDGVADGALHIYRGGANMIGSAARFESGVDTTHQVFLVGDFTHPSTSSLTYDGRWQPTANSINAKGGQLAGLLWKVA